MANLKNVIYISNENYNTLVTTGSVVIEGVTYTYDPNNVYVTPDTSEQLSNKTTTLSSASTDVQYPSAKCVYDNLETKQNTLTAGSGINITDNVISASSEETVLVIDCTLEEAISSKSFTSEENTDGRPLILKKCFLELRTNGNSAGNYVCLTGINGQYIFYSNAGDVFNSGRSGYYEQYSECSCGRIISYGWGWEDSDYVIHGYPMPYRGIMKSGASINKLFIGALSGTMPAGTTIKVYGVRA